MVTLKLELEDAFKHPASERLPTPVRRLPNALI